MIVCACMFSCVWLFATPWIVACQALLSTEFFRQEYWIGLPFPTPGGIPKPGIESTFPGPPGRLFTTARHPGSPWRCIHIFTYVCYVWYVYMYVGYMYIFNFMDRKFWWATVHRGGRIRHHWATKHSQIYILDYIISAFLCHSWSWCTRTWGWGTGLLEVFSPCYCPTPSISHSVVSDSLWSHGLSVGFSRQEYWSGLPFPSPGKSS